MMRFNFFAGEEVFIRNPETNTYLVDFDNMKKAVQKLVEQLIVIQGDGNYEAARQMIDNYPALFTKSKQIVVSA